jgi:antitoxin (DNA-binding transcriptional repressor) of toxin-antitoxin stability system
MKTISIRELHTRTGHYVRQAATEPITVTDRGQTIAIIRPATAAHLTGKPFPKRDRSTLPFINVDSGLLISEDRDAR